MKINSFFDKSSSNTSKKIQITASGVQNIVNGASVERLQSEVESLKSSLELSETKLQTTIEEHLKDKEQFSIAIRKSKEAQTETSKYAEQNNLLKLDNKALTETIGDKDKLIHDLKSKVYELNPLARKYAKAQSSYIATKAQFDTLTETHKELVKQKDGVLQELSDLKGYMESATTDFNTMKEKYSNMDGLLTTTKNQNSNLKSDLDQARRDIQTWKNGFQTLQEENHNLVGVKEQLSVWLGKIQDESSNLTGKTTMQNRELQKAKETITDMGKTVDDLLETNTYLREKNAFYMKELSKPRYVSIGAISKQEGFKFPSNFKAPKNSLGSGKPTLLKVREN